VEARNRRALELWLRLQGSDPIPNELDHMEAAIQAGSEGYLLSADNFTLRGGIMCTAQSPIAELRGGFSGLTDKHSGALIQAGVRLAQERGATHIFTVCESAEQIGLYKQQGFVNLDSVVIYRKRKPERHEQSVVQPVSAS
jgi:hypothetical protein